MDKLVIFDLDGTLVDTLPDIKNAVNNALNNCGFIVDYNEDEIMSFIGSGEYLLIKRALKKFNVDDEDVIKRVRKEYNTLYHNACCNQTKVFDGITSGLYKLKENGYKLVVFSNKPDSETKKVINKYFESGLFDFVRGGIEGFPIKPNKEGIELILKHFNIINTNNVYYVGDSDVDMQTGLNANLKTIGTSYGYKPYEVLNSFNPYKVVKTPSELFELILK